MGIQTIPLPSSSSLYSRVAFVTTSTTWAHPDGYSQARPVKVLKFNGGNGGSGGQARTNTSSVGSAEGYFGGASGFVQMQEGYVTSDLTVTIGAGGSGGSGAVLTTNGNASITPSSVPGIGGTTTVVGTGIYMVQSNTQAAWSIFNTSAMTSLSSRAYFGMSGGGGTGNMTGAALNCAGGVGGYPGIYNGNGEFASGGILEMYRNSGTAAPSSGATALPLAQYSPGGGAGGAGVASVTTVTGQSGGVHALVTTTAGGNGGNGVGVQNAAATGGSGSTGGIFGNGGGGGGGASIYISNATTYTATGGSGGSGGAGGVIIWY